MSKIIPAEHSAKLKDVLQGLNHAWASMDFARKQFSETICFIKAKMGIPLEELWDIDEDDDGNYVFTKIEEVPELGMSNKKSGDI